MDETKNLGSRFTDYIKTHPARGKVIAISILALLVGLPIFALVEMTLHGHWLRVLFVLAGAGFAGWQAQQRVRKKGKS